MLFIVKYFSYLNISSHCWKVMIHIYATENVTRSVSQTCTRKQSL